MSGGRNDRPKWCSKKKFTRQSAYPVADQKRESSRAKAVDGSHTAPSLVSNTDFSWMAAAGGLTTLAADERGSGSGCGATAPPYGRTAVAHDRIVLEALAAKANARLRQHVKNVTLRELLPVLAALAGAIVGGLVAEARSFRQGHRAPQLRVEPR